MSEASNHRGTERKAAIAKSQSKGRQIVGVLPIHYPKALFTALDLHAVELWGPPGPPAGPAAGRIQSYVCPLVRNALAFLASGKADDLDALLVPHTCDSLQGLATLLTDFGGWPKPVLTFLHPKGEARPSSRVFAVAELRVLGEKLEKLAGKQLDPDRLRAAMGLHKRMDAITSDLLTHRSRLEVPDAGFYALLRRGEYLWPEDHLAELTLAHKALGSEPRQHGVPLLVTGYVPEPMAILDILAEAGAYLAADDYAAIGRRIGGYENVDPSTGDPFETLAATLFSSPPCPTRSADSSVRMAHLTRLAERSGARGVLIHTVKFCEPELFDIPALRKTFAALKLPFLHLEGELETKLSMQASTRLEAFVEMLGAGKVVA